jgi:hypothetical protein
MRIAPSETISAAASAGIGCTEYPILETSKLYSFAQGRLKPFSPLTCGQALPEMSKTEQIATSGECDSLVA